MLSRRVRHRKLYRDVEPADHHFVPRLRTLRWGGASAPRAGLLPGSHEGPSGSSVRRAEALPHIRQRIRCYRAASGVATSTAISNHPIIISSHVRGPRRRLPSGPD